MTPEKNLHLMKTLDDPRWTPENRPVVDTSKPASGQHPEQLGFTLRMLGPASFSSSESFRQLQRGLY